MSFTETEHSRTRLRGLGPQQAVVVFLAFSAPFTGPAPLGLGLPVIAPACLDQLQPRCLLSL